MKECLMNQDARLCTQKRRRALECLSLSLLSVNNDIVEYLLRDHKGTYADDCSRVRHVSTRLNTAHILFFRLDCWPMRHYFCIYLNIILALRETTKH